VWYVDLSRCVVGPYFYEELYEDNTDMAIGDCHINILIEFFYPVLR